MAMSAGCALSHSNCLLSPALFEKTFFVGEFAYRVESAETVEGDYTPPSPSESWLALRFELQEEFMLGRRSRDDDPEVIVALDVVEHIDFTPVVTDITAGTTEYCTADPSTRTDPEPRWFERNHVLVDWSNDAVAMTRLDASLRAEDVTPMPMASPLVAFTRDADDLGFEVVTEYRVRPAGCGGDVCSARVRLRHHIRRTP
jgi:hypothetical protein